MSLFPDSDPKFQATYAEESAMVEASEAIAHALEHAGISRAELAELLDVSRAEVTHRLRGERNITVRKLAATLHVLGAELHIEARFSGESATRAPLRWVPRLPLPGVPTSQSSTVAARGYALPESLVA